MTAPEPLVPQEVDLRDFQYMELDVRRLRDSRFAAQVSGDAFRAGLLLWCASWHQVPAASVADDDVELANLAGYGRFIKEFQKIKDEAMHGWVLCSDGRWYHPVVAEKALAAWNNKMRHAFEKMTDRVRKMNRNRAQENLPPVAAPTFEAWMQSGRRDPVPPEKAVVPPEFPDSTPGASGGIPPPPRQPKPGIPPENALRGNGTERNGTEIKEKQQAASDPPPLREADPPPPPAALDIGQPEEEVANNPVAVTRLGRVANLLRQAGVRCGPSTAGVAALAADGRITDELLVEALVMLNERGKGTFGPQVVLLKALDLLKAAEGPRIRSPQSEFPAWRTDDKQADKLGAKLGLRPNAGEDYAHYRQRIGARLNELREAQAA